MDFLRIYQVISISNSFIRFKTVLDRASITRKIRGAWVKFSKTHRASYMGRRVYSAKTGGFLCKCAHRRGMGGSLPFDLKGTSPIRLYTRANWYTPEPQDLNPTPQINSPLF
jgi:hypothetical protein